MRGVSIPAGVQAGCLPPATRPIPKSSRRSHTPRPFRNRYTCRAALGAFGVAELESPLAALSALGLAVAGVSALKLVAHLKSEAEIARLIAKVHKVGNDESGRPGHLVQIGGNVRSLYYYPSKAYAAMTVVGKGLDPVIWTTTAAKNKLPLKVESQASEVPDLSFLPASSIDSVVLLPGCAPTPELVAQILRALKPGGRLGLALRAKGKGPIPSLLQALPLGPGPLEADELERYFPDTQWEFMEAGTANAGLDPLVVALASKSMQTRTPVVESVDASTFREAQKRLKRERAKAAKGMG
ncbi:hypothetical protein ACKKBF_B01570 [Auxenochlorella protothecoides x Auxenochlorella symbiontica]